MGTVAALREKLQAPRRSHDTFYGKYVMRKLSIYLTILFSKTSIAPSGVTLLSILVGWLGCWRLFGGDWRLGVLLINGWYLLDHVDGELARLKNQVSLTGLFFDTFANVIVPTPVFMFIGIGLTKATHSREWVYAGRLASFGYLSLLSISYCESACIVQWLREKREVNVTLRAIAQRGEKVLKFVSCLKRVFQWLHTLVTFPVVLSILTLVTVLSSVFGYGALILSLKIILLSYAILVNIVWITVLAQALRSGKIESTFAALRQ